MLNHVKTVAKLVNYDPLSPKNIGSNYEPLIMIVLPGGHNHDDTHSHKHYPLLKYRLSKK